MSTFRSDRLIGDDPALFVIDPQRDFLHPDGDLFCGVASADSDASEVVERINGLVETARASDVPIVWSKELHRADGSDRGTELLRKNPTHTTCDTWGEQFVDELDVDASDLNPAEYVVGKRRYNLFHGTDLDHLLRTFDVDTVVLTGVTTSVCVHYTAQGALERDYVFRTVEECTADKNRALHEAGLRCQDQLQKGGIQPFDRIHEELKQYEGSPVVEQLKSEGTLTTPPSE
jgi:nicotinamidase-related amidase